MHRFTKFLIEQTQKKLAEDTDPSSLQDATIADVVYAFNNRDMLKLLAKRAKYLQMANFDKA